MINSRWPAVGLLAVQAWLLWSSSELVVVPIVGLVLGCLSLVPALRLRLPLAVWAVVGLAAVAAVLTKCGLWHYPETVSTWVMPAPWTLALAECLLVVQGLMMLPRYADGRLPSWFPALSVISLAGVYNRTIEYDQHQGYLLAAIVAAVMVIAVDGTGRRSSSGRVPAGRSARPLILAGMGVAVVFFSWQLSDQMSRNVSILRPWSFDFGLRNRRTASGRSYVRDATLQSVTLAKSDQPSRVALRVVASRKPGYLRGRVFDTYEPPRWKSLRVARGDAASRARLNRHGAVERARYPDLPWTERDIQSFVLEPAASGPWYAMEIWNDPDRGPVFFLPLGTAVIQGQGGYVSVDQHGVLRGGISTRNPYTAVLERDRRSVLLSSKEREELVVPLKGLDPRVEQLAAEVCRGCSTPSEKMEAVREFFHENFRYALGQLRVPSGSEPLSHFLLNRPPAHCEFFASGAIALLRSQGVPSRYVTGYVVDEQDDYGDYWLARNRNAHAWVEAYDDGQKRWVIVEPTPGMFVPGGEQDESDDLDVAVNSIDSSRMRLGASMFDGNWSLGPWQTPLALVALVALTGCLIYLRPAWRARLHAALGFSPDPLRDYHRQLNRLDRRLRSRRLKRQPCETLHQFAERVRSRADRDPWLTQAADWYLAYAAVRYRTRDPNETGNLLPPLP